MNAELYGRVTDSFIGMQFPLYDAVGGYENWKAMFPAIRPYTEARHPSQIYEAILEGLVLALVSYFILYLSQKNKKIRRGYFLLKRNNLYLLQMVLSLIFH